jgi:L-ascorbate metabolism protein UlaG (beta-lactamase superfamily)
VGYRSHPDLGIADGEIVLDHVMEGNVASQLTEVDREVRWPHEVAEDMAQRPFLLLGPVHLKVTVGHVEGAEKGETLDVVPVDVGDQGGSLKGLAHRMQLAHAAKAGAQIKNDRILVAHHDTHARGVAAVSPVPRRRARARASDPEKCDFQRSP